MPAKTGEGEQPTALVTSKCEYAPPVPRALKRYRLSLAPDRALRHLRVAVLGEEGPFASFRPVSWRWRGAMTDFEIADDGQSHFELRASEEGEAADNQRLTIHGEFAETRYGSRLELSFAPAKIARGNRSRLRIFAVSFGLVTVALSLLAMLMGLPLGELYLRLGSQAGAVALVYACVRGLARRRAKRLRDSDARELLARLEGVLGPLELSGVSDEDADERGAYRPALPPVSTS